MRSRRFENFLLVTGLVLGAGMIFAAAIATHDGRSMGELRSQLAQASAQLSQVSARLKASQDRVVQLEGQLKRAPALGDLDAAKKQGSELLSQLSQASEQLKASQARVDQLEGQLKRAPALSDLGAAQKEVSELLAQRGPATEQLKASQARVVQLEDQLKRAPALSKLDPAQKPGSELLAQLGQAIEQLKVSQARVDQLDARLQQAPALNDLEPVVEAAFAPTRHPNNSTSTGPADSAPPPDPAPHSPSTTDISVFLARGDSLVGAGDVVSARLFYQRAAAGGNGKAALRLGETYDPAFLKLIQASIQGDHTQAAYWYRQALQLGQSEAEVLLIDAQAKSE